MRPSVQRVLLGLLAVSALIIGIWAQFFPESFYGDFPGPGRGWVAVDGPYNEHLIRDVGGLNLALAVLTISALAALGRRLVATAAIAWLVYSIPHLLYHGLHLDGLTTAGQIVEMASLGAAIAAPIVLLALLRPDEAAVEG